MYVRKGWYSEKKKKKKSRKKKKTEDNKAERIKVDSITQLEKEDQTEWIIDAIIGIWITLAQLWTIDEAKTGNCMISVTETGTDWQETRRNGDEENPKSITSINWLSESLHQLLEGFEYKLRDSNW